MSASPIYVHVQDNTPLHVLVKKPKRTDNSKQESRRFSGRTGSRVLSKIATEQWIPAPGKTSTRDPFDKNYKWDSEKAQLEINQPKSYFHLHAFDQGPLKESDLSTEEENHLHNNIIDYEKKIEALMAEVGTLKNELELKQVEKELEDKKEQLEISKAILEDKQRELRYITKEFEDTERENFRLRKSMEKYQEDLATSIEKLEPAVTNDDTMHRQLVALEVCGAEAGKQAAALTDIIQRLKYEKRLSHTDINALNNQRELFLQILEEFETSNRTVRRLLLTEHKTLSDVKRLESQRDILMKKLADSDIFRVRSELIQKSADLEQLLVQVNEEKNHARTLNELNKSVEGTWAPLQRELRSKEMENNRLQIHLQGRDSPSLIEEQNNDETAQRPPYSLVALVMKALETTPAKRMTTVEIYRYFQDNFPYFCQNEERWKNSLRHCLSKNDCFVKVPREVGNGRKNCYWSLHPDAHDMFADDNFKKRVKLFTLSKSNE